MASGKYQKPPQIITYLGGENEKKLIMQVAARLGMSASEFVRTAALPVALQAARLMKQGASSDQIRAALRKRAKAKGPAD